MKIVEILKELPLIEKKILKNTEMIQGYSSFVKSAEDITLPLVTQEKHISEVHALHASTFDLALRRAHLRRALSLVNANTNVTIDSLTKSIAEWIELRRFGINYIVNSLRAHNDKTGTSLLNSTKFDPAKGISILRFYDQSERDRLIRQYEDMHSRIDAVLETVNATTDVPEEYLN